jgi:uncharacterized Zn-binding protein involved in type VI secretion
MPPAARVGDSTAHPGLITGPGCLTVLIAGQPAARLGDMHACSMPPTAGPHPPTAIVQGSSTVLIGGQPAARLGDTVGCGAVIIKGAATVLIGG